MAVQQVESKSWIQEAAPYFAVLLIAAHVFAMVFWMYKLATEKPRDKRSQRWKSH